MFHVRTFKIPRPCKACKSNPHFCVCCGIKSFVCLLSSFDFRTKRIFFFHMEPSNEGQKKGRRNVIRYTCFKVYYPMGFCRCSQSRFLAQIALTNMSPTRPTMSYLVNMRPRQWLTTHVHPAIMLNWAFFLCLGYNLT